MGALLYCYITFDCTFFFEITKKFGIAMALQVNEILVKHGFNAWVIAYVKDEGNNLSTMI
jgi:hypothetical protein